MDYIQRIFASSIKDKKDLLFKRYKSLKVDLLEHCKVPVLSGFVVGREDGDYLKLQFPDLDYGVYAKPRIAFNEELQAGLRVNFYDDRNEWVISLLLNPNGYYSLEAKNGGPYTQYEHDDTNLPIVIIHALLTSAHKSGRITL
ncbi:hypothetical protein A9B99_17110 [Mangrovibacter phragmitis]|uniref:Uncharacterized protein n=1 Tax=Mangrovibacter phragmitis TaxID=1691903 RepID=A0A1B7KY21_9ENTR|nr:hypothetical protein [Mangrovibacter phragmitis]OAT74907.1 hypothetical protein A9B99_17110 [Mangrovibacter phragmitis]